VANATKWTEQAKELPATKIDFSKVTLDPILSQALSSIKDDTVFGSDCWGCDPLPQMEQTMYDTITGLCTGVSPADTAKAIQKQIDDSK
jgi:hypothetical protein